MLDLGVKLEASMLRVLTGYIDPGQGPIRLATQQFEKSPDRRAFL